MDDDLAAAVDAAEESVAEDVAAVLTEVAEEFAAGLAGATEIVAARFSVSSIAAMWRERVPRLVRRLLRVVETSAATAAESVDAPMPAGWNDLAGRYDEDRPLPASLGSYVETTEHLLRAVGDRLSAVAVAELAEGLDAGEDIEQLRARLRAAFTRESAQLGTVREELIARTESGRAWNTGTLAVGQDLTGPARPLVKQWLTRFDTRVRDAHSDVNGQLRLLDEPFTVAGVSMASPGDPTAPAELVCNCFPGDTLVQAPSGIRHIFRRWYEGPLVEVHTKHGGKLSGTPNHPLLTDSGWQAMERVEVGDQLIGAPVGVRVGPGDPDVEHVPPSFAEIYRAAHEAGMPSRVVGARVDFHGDAANGGVEVVTVNGDLWPDRQASGLQPVDDAVLGRPRDRAPNLAGAGDPGSAGHGNGVTGLLVGAAEPAARHASRAVRGVGEGRALLEREPLHPQPVRLAPVADLRPGFDEASPDHGAADAERGREGEFRLPSYVSANDLGIVDGGPADDGEVGLRRAIADLDTRAHQDAADDAMGALVVPHEVLERLAGHVTLHDVVAVERRQFVGHVYNLETEDHWYIANDIAAHNCRCVLALAHANQTAAIESKEPLGAGVSDAREQHVTTARTAAADGSHLQGAMIALMPTPEDAQRLALDGGEAVDELHLTLMFLGDDGGAWTSDQRNELVGDLQVVARTAFTGPIGANAFGAAHWNAQSDSPSWVWSVGDDRDRPEGATTLFDAHNLIVSALEDTHDRPELPAPHSPWAAHVCAAYSDDPALLPELESRLGPIVFDRLRVTFAGDATDIPLGPQEEPMQPDETAAGMPARRWSTPDDTALAYEDQETGDGRIFSAGSLQWDTGPWPLQYADEMLSGHDGAELAGSIETMNREGDRLTGTGVIYTSRPAGADAVMLLDEGAPLGVSVDLDDVDVEFVDRTVPAEDADGEFYSLAAAASLSLASASLLRLPDGAWMIVARTAGEWTASGASLSRSHHTVQLITGPGGQITRAAVQAAFGGTGLVTAAAGDPDDPDGIVVHAETAGDYLLRITRARVRGATLVSMPAYDKARIVLDPIEDPATASAATAAAGDPSEAQRRVIAYVSTSPGPVGARDVAQALGMPMMAARQHLARATEAGRLVRLGAGQYVGVSTLPEGSQAFTSDEDTAPDGGELLASAWTAMREADPMPAAWFREPTVAELPPGSGGVHYAAGRVWGWVAQAGEPHAGMPGRNLTIESLGTIDTTHFLRAKFKLDDGTFAKVGAYTMNVGHHRDGAECNDAVCQFDDSRTVAAIVTVGMNERGMWFSGAAAPWLSEWDRRVFSACQPSYHMRQGPGGRWQLRAVLTVPVPGHSSPLLAAVVERAGLALAASAAAAPDTVSGHLADMSAGVSADVSAEHADGTADQHGHRPDTVSGNTPNGHPADTGSGHRPDTSGNVSGEIVAALDALLTSPAFLDRFSRALEKWDADHTAAARAEVARLTAAVAPARQEIAAGMAGAGTTGGK